MPTFEKLSDAEIQQLGKRRQPTLDLSEYHAFLDGMTSGDWGRLTLGAEDNQRTVKRRLTTASRKRGLEIKYRKAPEGQVLFQIR